MKKTSLLLAVVLLGATVLSAARRPSVEIPAGGAVLQVYVLRLNPAVTTEAHYDVGILLDGPMDVEAVDERARYIGKNGLRSGNDYYPPNAIQRIHIYISPSP